jgi:alpha-galactosidase
VGHPTVVVVGAGSAVFGLAFLQDFFQVPALRGATLRLVDVHAPALDRMRRLAERLDAAASWDASIESFDTVEEALPGAGFVVVSIAQDRVASWQADHELALRHGFPSVLSENGGPGGLSHTLRSVPLVLGVAEAVERLAPDALVINYTNPANRISLAISRYTSVNAVGLCHGVAGTKEWMARLLGWSFADLDLEVAGVNHFNWVTALTDRATGDDLMSAFREALDRLPADEWRLCRYAFERLGSFPTTGDDHIGEYLPWAAGIMGTAGYDFEGFGRYATETVERIEAWGRGERPVDELLAELSVEGKVDHSAAALIGGLVEGGDAGRPSFILPNDGLIPDLRADAVVEVAGQLRGGRITGRPVAGLPTAPRALVAHELEIQSLAVEAAVTGSRELALEALLIDPVVHDASAAEAFLDAILDRHRRLLPRFWDGAAPAH